MHADNSSLEIGMHTHISGRLKTLNVYAIKYVQYLTMWIHKQYFDTYKFVLFTYPMFCFYGTSDIFFVR